MRFSKRKSKNVVLDVAEKPMEIKKLYKIKNKILYIEKNFST